MYPVENICQNRKKLAPNNKTFFTHTIQKMQGMSGWLRKRPRFAGAWPNRFVQLTADGKLVIYSKDPTTLENQLIVALYTVHVPKNVEIEEPVEKLVRIKRNGPKKEKVVAIRVRFKNTVLFTLGAPSKEEADKWKAAIEEASRMTEAPEELLLDHNEKEESVTSGGAKEIRQSMLPEGFQDGTHSWHVVEDFNGMQIEGQKESEYPLLRAKTEVKGTPLDIFELIMDDSKRPQWDEGVTMSKILKTINENTHIVYMQTKEIWVGPVYTGPRDLVLLRYWRKDDDGDFVITWQSVEDNHLAPVSVGYTRGRIFHMTISVSSTTEKNLSRVLISCHADPGSSVSYMPTNVLNRWLTPFVTRVLGIEKAIESNNSESVEVVDRFPEELAERMIRLETTDSVGLTESNTLKLGSWNHNEWMETPLGETFKIRGKTYLTDNVKVRSSRTMFHLVAADLNKTKAPVPHCAARADSPLKRIQEYYPDRQIIVMQMIMPGPPFYILALYGVSKPGVCEEDTPFSRLWNDFVEGTDEYRNTVFKLIPRVTRGAYIVKKTVGEVPAVLGQKVKLNYYVGPNYVSHLDKQQRT